MAEKRIETNSKTKKKEKMKKQNSEQYTKEFAEVFKCDNCFTIGFSLRKHEVRDDFGYLLSVFAFLSIFFFFLVSVPTLE